MAEVAKRIVDNFHSPGMLFLSYGHVLYNMTEVVDK